MGGSCFRLYRRCSTDCLPSPTGCWAIRALSPLNWYAPDTQGPIFNASSTTPATLSPTLTETLIDAAMLCSSIQLLHRRCAACGASAGKCGFSYHVADGDATSCGFAEFSPK